MQMAVRGKLALGLLLAVVGAAAGAAPTDDARGEELYSLCGSCHGARGAGNQSYGAPAIAGMSQWYVEAQLRKFRSGWRGAHPFDVEGLRMRPMSRALGSDEDVRAVSAYVAGLAPARPEPVLGAGDPRKGEALYTTCATCHGADGTGNQQLSAPALVHQSDWYLLRQIGKFKSGVRGSNPQDLPALQMRGMSMVLIDEQATRDVIAHIMTLSR
jgi:cytochrome c oxidase subunit 2